MNEFAARLRAIMDKYGVSQAELVKRTGISKANISSYLAGKYLPKQNNIYKISVALGIKPSTLLGMDEEGRSILHPPITAEHFTGLHVHDELVMRAPVSDWYSDHLYKAVPSVAERDRIALNAFHALSIEKQVQLLAALRKIKNDGDYPYAMFEINGMDMAHLKMLKDLSKTDIETIKMMIDAFYAKAQAEATKKEIG